AEDRTLADVRDEVFALPAGATVRLAHPLLLGGDLAAWSELFADYEILKPFRLLGRLVFEQWRLAGMPAQDGFALHALGRPGDADTVLRLTPMLPAWPGEASHQTHAGRPYVLARTATTSHL
ncbi:hypothetical protein VM98_34830, partial [Streptomyces rubellomurinus subsp. indigoferus]